MAFFKNFLAKNEYGNRIGRLGFHQIQPFRNGLLGIQKGNIVFKAKEEYNFRNVFSDFRGSRPLNMLVDNKNSWTCFGEYFGNPDRDAVKVFHSLDGINWEVCYTFKEGEIRHIHGIFSDPYRDGHWCLTGDSNSESGLWFTPDKFRTLEKIIYGSQKARAVEIIPAREGLIVPMDSPLEKNYINFVDLETKSFSPLASLPGSAFHATVSNDIYFVTTVTEPSKVNITRSAKVFASLDGINWECISEFQKDFFPIKYQGITRYSEIIIPPGENNTDSIFGFARAIKGGSGMIVWDKQEIIDFLSSRKA